MTATVESPSNEAAADRKVPLVELRNVGKSYGNITALKDISLRVHAGQVTGILGDNGAGKSTLIKIIAGLHQQTDGELLVDGEATKFSSPADALGKGIATVYQNLAVVPLMPVCRNFFLGQEVRKKSFPWSLDANAMRATTLAELSKMGIELPDVDAPIGSLSGGQRQRVLFALAVVPDPDLIVLDEPTVAMDVESRRAFWASMRLLARDGRSVLFATHYLEEADANADRIVLLARGRVVADGPATQIKAAVDVRRIRCTLPGADTAALAALPGVRTVESHGETVILSCGDADMALRALLAAEPTARDLEVTGARLEDAFLALTS
jgi:simple sugar transport system ATP-binding protein